MTENDAVKLKTLINSKNSEIQEINWPNCTIPTDQLLSMVSCTTKLRCLNLSNCQLQPSVVKQLFNVLKQIKYLQHVDLSGNKMKSNAVDEIAAMIKSNGHIQSLSLPNCVLDQKDLRIIIQAMQTVSSLQYVDFTNGILEDELGIDVATLFVNYKELKQLNFENFY